MSSSEIKNQWFDLRETLEPVFLNSNYMILHVIPNVIILYTHTLTSIFGNFWWLQNTDWHTRSFRNSQSKHGKISQYTTWCRPQGCSFDLAHGLMQPQHWMLSILKQTKRGRFRFFISFLNNTYTTWDINSAIYSYMPMQDLSESSWCILKTHNYPALTWRYFPHHPLRVLNRTCHPSASDPNFCWWKWPNVTTSIRNHWTIIWELFA